MKALDQATGYHQPLCLASRLVTGHFEDGIDGFLLRASYEGAGVDDYNVGIARRWE